MLSIFKSNNPFVVIFYPAYLVLFRVIFFFTLPETDFVSAHREPLSQLLFGFLEQAFGNYTSISLITAGVICFIQALLINQLVNSNKILSRKTYVGGALYLIFCSLFKEGLFLSPALIALTFLILSVHKMFTLFKQDKPSTQIFDVGFFCALSTLFYFPSVIFLGLAFVGLATIRAFAYREWVTVLLGFLSPFVLVFAYYFWFDKTATLIPDVMNLQHVEWLLSIKMSYVNWGLIAALLGMTLVLVVSIPAALYNTLIQVRKFVTILVIFIPFAGVSFLLQQRIELSHLVLLSLPLSIIATLLVSQIKSKALTEFVHLILLLMVLTGQILPLFSSFKTHL